MHYYDEIRNYLGDSKLYLQILNVWQLFVSNFVNANLSTTISNLPPMY